jgi:alkylhydroperoxidase family enzyme
MVCKSMRAAEHVDQFIAASGGDVSQSIVARGGAAPDDTFYAAVDQWRSADCFSQRERIAIEHSERMAEDPRGFADDEAYWSRLHAAFSDDEIVDLTLSVAAWMAMGRVTHVLELDTIGLDDMLAA